MGNARAHGSLTGLLRGPFEAARAGGRGCSGGRGRMDGLALAAHSELGDGAGIAGRSHCQHGPEWLDGTEGFPAGRRARIGVAVALRIAAQPGCRRLETGGGTGCFYGTGVAGGSVAYVDPGSWGDGCGSGDLQTTNASDHSKYRAHPDLVGHIPIAGHASLSRQSRLAESSVRGGAGVHRSALWDSLEIWSCGLECGIRYPAFFEDWPPKPGERRLRKLPPCCP